ncbi:MAG: RecQ family zinc-binding domain-containing protein, partial [Bacteroidetes bacterium]|nr:RecQ family zinc-binding domain-containing protein [Bacteroidota bacterium]
DARRSREALMRGGSWRQKHRARRRYAAMRRWMERDACRRWGVLGYFGEHAADRCGGCDVCDSRDA